MPRPFSADDPAVLLLDTAGRVVCANTTSAVLTARGGTAEGQTLQDLVGVPHTLFRRTLASAQRLRLTLGLEDGSSAPGQSSETTWECLAVANRAGAIEHVLLTGYRSEPRRSVASTEASATATRRRLLPVTTTGQAWAFYRGTLRFAATNAPMATRHGYRQEELAAMMVLDLMPWDQVEGFLVGMAKLAPAVSAHAVSRHLDRQGRVFELEEDYATTESDERPVCVVLGRETS